MMMDNFDNDKLKDNENGEMQQGQHENLLESKIEEPKPIRHFDYNEVRSHKKETYKRPSGLSYLAVGIIGAMIGGFIMAAIAPTYLFGKIIPYPENNKADSTQLGQQIVIKPSDDITVATAVSTKTKPAVVGISTISVERDIFGYARQSEGVGSGFVVDPRGYIVTNAHVVGENPKELTVYFIDGKELAAEVLWKDTTLDMAVIKVDATNLPIVELGDSDTIEVGELAIAIGNPLGLRYDRTVTQGIISGLNRTIQVSQTDIMEDLIQTDAAINPGNSGGPLINNEGHIIGINTAKASAEGLGFAIPINIAKPIISQLINEGKFQATYLGIGLLDREIAGYLNTDIQIKKGIYITSVLAGYAADKAGLKPEDLITHVDGIEVNTMIKFKSVLYSKKPGDEITITYERENKSYETEATLMAKPEE
jgi:S1-C subfamily serine protease